jgi:hypothetical protein
MIAITAGGSRAQSEAQRTITEKLFALIRGGSTTFQAELQSSEPVTYTPAV